MKLHHFCHQEKWIFCRYNQCIASFALQWHSMVSLRCNLTRTQVLELGPWDWILVWSGLVLILSYLYLSLSLSLSVLLSLSSSGQRSRAKRHCSLYTLTNTGISCGLSLYLYFHLSFYVYLSLSLSSQDSVCHQLSENIWFDRLAVVLWWFIRL